MRIESFELSGTDASGLAARLRSTVSETEDVSAVVAKILARVRAGGDAALREIAAELDEAPGADLAIDPEAIAIAPALLEADVREALTVAARNINEVAAAELEAQLTPVELELKQGQRVSVVASPVRAVGIYAPGGRAAYPSSVLMAALPARAAGVARVCVVSPPGGSGKPPDAVLAACAIAAVDEVYALGGAQAIGALAYGTESVAPVDVIVGPGNRFVTEAKRQVSGRVGIDSLAGPSELFVIADGAADARLIALDLLAQAEHGDDSPLVVASPDAALLDRVRQLVEELAPERPSVADAPLALVHTPGIELALSLADAFAPEHLELAFKAGHEAARGRVAGCVFVGSAAATAFGDYAAGSNHVLPTGAAARFGGPLGAGAFLRRTSIVFMPSSAAGELAPHVDALARAEGLPVHGESATARAK